jgi:hypothetical protein
VQASARGHRPSGVMWRRPVCCYHEPAFFPSVRLRTLFNACVVERLLLRVAARRPVMKGKRHRLQVRVEEATFCAPALRPSVGHREPRTPASGCGSHCCCCGHCALQGGCLPAGVVTQYRVNKWPCHQAATAFESSIG